MMDRAKTLREQCEEVVLQTQPWLKSLTIQKIISISPILHEDLAIHASSAHEVTTDGIIAKAVLLIASYFSHAITHKGFDTEVYKSHLSRAVELGQTLLPLDCPLLEYLMQEDRATTRLEPIPEL